MKKILKFFVPLSLFFISCLSYSSSSTEQEELETSEILTENFSENQIEILPSDIIRKLLVDDLVFKIAEGQVVGEETNSSNKKTILWENDEELNKGIPLLKNITEYHLNKRHYLISRDKRDMFYSGEHSVRYSLNCSIIGLKYLLSREYVNMLVYWQDDFSSEIELTAEWEIYDHKYKRVIFKSEITGHYRNGNKVESVFDLIYAGLGDSAEKLMNDPGLSFLITNGKKGERNESLLYDITQEEYSEELKPIKTGYSTRGPNITLPREVESIFSAIVTIQTTETQGSGFLISKDGYILTGAHVVGNESLVNIVMESGDSVLAEVLRLDRVSDSALLKIEGSNFPHLPLSETIPGIGYDVFAVGTPLDLGLSYTVSRGIISGKRKDSFVQLLQTDAAVNSGNSGGPLMDESGYVVGIISSKIMGEGIEGLAFAVSIKDIVDNLLISK